MSRRALWITAAVLAAVAALLTAWLTPRTTGGSRHGWRTGRLAPTHPRVAALAPGVSRIISDLGCGDLIVARHAYDKWSDQSIAICGDQTGIDYEKLIATNPTHVFVQLGEKDLPDALVKLGRERGWVVRNIPLLTLDDISHATFELSAAVVTPELDVLRAEDAALTRPAVPSEGQREREKRLTETGPALVRRIELAYANDPALASAGRVLLLYQGEGETGGAKSHPAALGPGSYSHDILLRIGGRSATPTGKAFMPLDVEDVAALSPPADAIVIVRPRDPGIPKGPAPSADELLGSLGPIARLDIPAVKAKRIAIIDDPMALIPGTNLAAFADELRAILKQWSGPMAPDVHGK